MWWFFQDVCVPIAAKLASSVGVPYVLTKGIFPKIGLLRRRALYSLPLCMVGLPRFVGALLFWQGIGRQNARFHQERPLHHRAEGARRWRPRLKTLC